MTITDQTGVSAPDLLDPARLGPTRLRNRIVKVGHVRGRDARHLRERSAHRLPHQGRSRSHGHDCRRIPRRRRAHSRSEGVGANRSRRPRREFTVERRPAPPTIRPPQCAIHEHRPRVERADVRRIVEAHTQTTRYARDVGFDAVEIHRGHNYLASSFLSLKVNHRKDAAHLPSCRVPRRILTSVGEAADSETAALAEMKIAPGGLWLDGSLPFAKMIESDGHLDAFSSPADRHCSTRCTCSAGTCRSRKWPRRMSVGHGRRDRLGADLLEPATLSSVEGALLHRTAAPRLDQIGERCDVVNVFLSRELAVPRISQDAHVRRPPQPVSWVTHPVVKFGNDDAPLLVDDVEVFGKGNRVRTGELGGAGFVQPSPHTVALPLRTPAICSW